MNKMVKYNMTRFDYVSRKLGILGLIIIAVALLLGLPLLKTLTDSNQVLVQEIREVNAQTNQTMDDLDLKTR